MNSLAGDLLGISKHSPEPGALAGRRVTYGPRRYEAAFLARLG